MFLKSGKLKKKKVVLEWGGYSGWNPILRTGTALFYKLFAVMTASSRKINLLSFFFCSRTKKYINIYASSIYQLNRAF